MKKEEDLKQAVIKGSKEGKISGHIARNIAEELEVPYKLISEICNEEKIKIYACELGCF